MISPASADLRSPLPDRLRSSAPPDSIPIIPIGPISPITETVTPADTSALAAAVRAAFERQQAVYPVGGGTSLDYGRPRTKSGIALSLAALDRVLDYPADDLTVTVEAGITLAELNRWLAEKRQWLPLDPPEADKATMGGIIAANACGPRRHGYGTVGDYLVGFRAIDGRGEVFCGGGKVVKNAAGYNLPRLMVGSLGALGVIVEATFMVRPLPGYSALLIRDVPSFEQVEDLLAGLGRSQAMPTIVELLAGPARPHCPLPAMPGTAAARLAIGFEGGPVEVPAMLAALHDEWKRAGADDITTIAGAGVASITNWLGASPASIQINVLPSRLVGLVEQLAKLLPDRPLQAHASSGVVRVFPPEDGSTISAEHFVELVRNELRPLACAAGGRLTVLEAPEGANLTAADIWGPPRAGASLMRAIQQRFDPAGILNPGRSWL
jgi:glycolate oxidase FAD binding subunit